MSCPAADPIVALCSGATGSPTTEDLINIWATTDCIGAYRNLLNSLPSAANPVGTIIGYNPDQQVVLQGCVDQLFEVFLTTNSLTDNVTSPSYSPFQETLLDVCVDPSIPGVCSQFLDGFCPADRTTVINSPTLTDFCGCYTTPDPDYLFLTNNPACDPLCHRNLTSQQLVEPDTTGAIATCPQNICVIDQTVINAQNSTAGEGINFVNVCSGCTGPNGCLCIISGVSIETTLASIGIGQNLAQFCGGQSVCLVEDSSGNIISQGACSTGDIPIPTQPVEPYWPIVVVMAVLLLVVIFLIIASKFT